MSSAATLASSSPLDDTKTNDGTALSPEKHIMPSSSELSTQPSAVIQHSEAGLIAQQVFNTGELLECIVSYLDPAEILSVMGVQRRWRDTVEGSIKLKRLLGLAPGGKFFSSPFFGSCVDVPERHEHGVISERCPKRNQQFATCSIGHPYVREDPDSWVGKADTSNYEVSLDLTAVAQTGPLHHHDSPELLLQRLGLRVRDMAIFNPPLKAAQIELECWNCSYMYDRDGHGSWPPIHSTSERGLTVGDLADMVRAIAKSEHRPCASRCFFMRGRITLEPDDPIVKSWIIAREDTERKEKYKEIVQGAFESNQWRAERDDSCNNEPIEFVVRTNANNYDDDGQEVSVDVLAWAASVLRSRGQYTGWDSDYDSDEDDEVEESEEEEESDVGDVDDEEHASESPEASNADPPVEEEDSGDAGQNKQELDRPGNIAAPASQAGDEDKEHQEDTQSGTVCSPVWDSCARDAAEW
jgi:hypothetical protein